MQSACKRNVGILLLVLAVLVGMCAYSCSLNSKYLSTGLIDEELKEKLQERPYLTPDEYEQILRQIEYLLEIDPNNLSANLLKAELETTPVVAD